MLAAPAHAAYPDKPVHLLLSFPPAGATDVLARAIGQKMSEALGQSVIVENRPGAGGNIGLIAAARAPADGTVADNFFHAAFMPAASCHAPGSSLGRKHCIALSMTEHAPQ
jgi:tripartite-type tricarboxylate transporter receptor subunit TctC